MFIGMTIIIIPKTIESTIIFGNMLYRFLDPKYESKVDNNLDSDDSGDDQDAVQNN